MGISTHDVQVQFMAFILIIQPNEYVSLYTTTTWNVGVRRRFKLPNTTQTWMLGSLLDSVHMK